MSLYPHGGNIYWLAAIPFLVGAVGTGPPVASLLLALVTLLLTAKFGGFAAQRIGQPPVLGELLAGIALGSLGLLGLHALEYLRGDPTVAILAELGVILLLFEVGLDAKLADLMRVGLSSLLVALLGVAAPFALGWIVSAALLPSHSLYVHLFLGATLCATSVGITARVLQDLGKTRTAESRVILGAAIIDDVLGLIILAVVTSMIGSANGDEGLSAGSVALITGKAVVFLAGSLLLGILLAKPLFRWAARLRMRGMLLTLSLSVCFLLAYFAHRIGLAPIVGAFAAGLILEGIPAEEFQLAEERSLEDLLHPLSTFLVPLFFIHMGLQVDLRTIAQPGVLGLAAALTLVAIVGKLVCGIGTLGKGFDRVSIGIGMVPRGEVGLIFANVGLALSVGQERIIDQAIFSAIVIMVVVTTLITPPALRWSLLRRRT